MVWFAMIVLAASAGLVALWVHEENEEEKRNARKRQRTSDEEVEDFTCSPAASSSRGRSQALTSRYSPGRAVLVRGTRGTSPEH